MAYALARHRIEPGIGSGSFLHQRRFGMLARIGFVQAVLIRQQHQQVGGQQTGHHSRQRVVVAKFDLLRGYRVVLVDDRHYAEIE